MCVQHIKQINIDSLGKTIIVYNINNRNWVKTVTQKIYRIKNKKKKNYFGRTRGRNLQRRLRKVAVTFVCRPEIMARATFFALCTHYIMYILCVYFLLMYRIICFWKQYTKHIYKVYVAIVLDGYCRYEKMDGGKKRTAKANIVRGKRQFFKVTINKELRNAACSVFGRHL